MATATRCDGCGAYAPTPEPQPRQQDRPLPVGWVPVTVGAGQVAKRLDFCCAECAAVWFLELGQVAATVVAADPARFGRPPHEWDMGTWVAFCAHHGVSQPDALRYVVDKARAAGAPLTVGKWASLADRPDLAADARAYVLDHSATLRNAR